MILGLQSQDRLIIFDKDIKGKKRIIFLLFKNIFKSCGQSAGV